MSHAAAKIILDTVVKHGAEQDAVLEQIKTMCSQEEFNSYRRMIGKSMGTMLVEIINPIVEEYPDLRPPQLQ